MSILTLTFGSRPGDTYGGKTVYVNTVVTKYNVTKNLLHLLSAVSLSLRYLKKNMRHVFDYTQAKLYICIREYYK